MVSNVDEGSLFSLIRERIVADFDPLRILVFGSRARGDARPDSDVDLLVVFSEVSDKRAAAVGIRAALRDLPIGKDVIVTTPGEIEQRGNLVGSILRPALRDGKVLYERN